MTELHMRGTQNEHRSVTELLDDLSSENFRRWYRNREYRQNIRNGQSYFNSAGATPDPERHSPSQLLQCQRKMVYRKENAPAERPDPEGIFWFGSEFEESLLFPFLERAITGSTTFVQNSIWIDYTVETPAGEIEIRGATDPVIVDADATPILPTEAKTKSSTDGISEPNRHHRAQIHAYLIGLSKKFEKQLTDAVIIYGGRESLDLKTFHVEFDQQFWDDVVVDWAAKHTEYRLNDELPPADPEFEWECRFCSFRHRCGKANTDHEDYGPEGLLPEFERYPRENVIEYLEGHPEESLTPTLAKKYPDLAEVYGAPVWYCSNCESEIGWQNVETIEDPLCPQCADEGVIFALSLSTSGDGNSEFTRSVDHGEVSESDQNKQLGENTNVSK